MCRWWSHRRHRETTCDGDHCHAAQRRLTSRGDDPFCSQAARKFQRLRMCTIMKEPAWGFLPFDKKVQKSAILLDEPLYRLTGRRFAPNKLIPYKCDCEIALRCPHVGGTCSHSSKHTSRRHKPVHGFMTMRSMHGVGDRTYKQHSSICVQLCNRSITLRSRTTFTLESRTESGPYFVATR